MSIGTLRAKIVRGDAKRVRYGSNDPVSGIIFLTYEPSGRIPVTAELFGPLKVAVVLTGESRIRMWRQLRNSYTVRCIFRPQRTLPTKCCAVNHSTLAVSNSYSQCLQLYMTNPSSRNAGQRTNSPL